MAGENELFGVRDRTNPIPATLEDIDSAYSALTQNPPVAAPSIPTPSERPSLAGEFVSGVSSGLRQLGTDFQRTGAMVMALGGWEKDALDLMEIAVKRDEDSAREFPKTINRIEDVESINDLVRWASRSLGEQIPNVASAFLGGGAGFLLGKLIGRGALSLGGSLQLAAKFPVLGSGIGTLGATTAIETGATAGELFQATNQMQPELALGAGVVKGALESLTPLMLGRSLGLSPGLSRVFGQRVLKEYDNLLPGRLGSIIKIGGVEGLTETLQEAVDIAARSIVDESYDFLGEDARSRLLNAAAGGAFVGSVFGLAHRGNRQKTQMEEATPYLPPEFDIGKPDISTQEEITGLPAQTRLSISQPVTFPSLKEELLGSIVRQDVLRPPTSREELVQALANGPKHVYDPTKPPSPVNTTGRWASVSDFITEPERRGLHIRPQSDFVRDAFLWNLETDNKTVTSSGETYNFLKHKAGTAMLLRDLRLETSKEDIQLMQRLAHFLNIEMKRIGIKEKLILYERGLNDKLLDVTGWGVLSPFNNLAAIGVNFEVLRKIQTEIDGKQNDKELAHYAFSTIAHEFGHFLSYTKLKNKGANFLAKLLANYERDLSSAVLGDWRHAGKFFEGRMALTYRLDEFGELPKEAFTEKPRAAAISFDLADRNYHFSFEEWFAENVSKYYSEAYVQQPPLIADNEVRKFFRELARDLKEFFTRVAKIAGMNADPMVREFMNSLRRAYVPELTVDGFRHAELQGIKENIEALKNPKGESQTNGEFVPPPQLSTGGLFNLIGKILPGKQAREIRAHADKFNWFMDLFLNMQQIGQHNPHIKPLHRYLEFADQWYNFQMDWMSRADQRIREWTLLGRKQGENLSQFIFAIERMEYLTPKEIEAGVVRHPTEGELRGLATKYGVNEAGFSIYTRIREDFDAVLNQIEQTSLRDIDRTITEPIINAAEKTKLSEEMARLRQRPYFPHARFGQWAVVVKDKKGGKTIYMEQFETHREAVSAAADKFEQIKKEYPDAVVYPDYIPKEIYGFRGLPPMLLTKIKEKLKLTETQREWLENLIVEMAPAVSFRHHLQKRKDTPGFSLNAKRAYAEYFFHGARHLARIEFGPLMEEEVTKGMNQSIAGLQDPGMVVDVTKRRRIQEYMANHLEHILNPKADWWQLRSGAFQWYLGFNVSSAFLNLTQVPLVAGPYLAARYGDAKAISALMKSVKDIQNVYKYREADRVPDALVKALDRAMKEGIIDESQAAELASVAQGAYLSRFMAGTKLQRFVQQMGYYGSWMFQQSERLNRRIVFRAAHQLAMESPNSAYITQLVDQNRIAMGQMLDAGFNEVEARAYLAAKDAVRRTQFQYAQHARPKFMRGKKAVVFTFFMFTQSMLHFAFTNPGAVRYWVLMLAAAGLMGLPGAEDAEALARLLARNLLGKDFDVQRELRELVVGLAGDSIPADLVLHGAGRVGFGLPAMMDFLGLPKPSFDFSRRMGLGRVIPGLAELATPGLDFDEAMSRVSTQAAGAVFGIGFNMVKALSDNDLPFGDFKRWERAMPTSLSNFTRAVRYFTEERERSRTGATIVDYNMTDPDHLVEIALRAVGFQPTRVQRQWDRIRMQREAEAYWTGRRAVIMKLWNHSFTLNDSELRESALADVRRFNEEVPFGIMKIRGDQLAKSRKEHLRQVRLREAGLTRQKSMRPLAKEISSLHPETLPSEVVDIEDVSNMR